MMIAISLYPMEKDPAPKIIGVRWRSSIDSVGFVAVAVGPDQMKWRAYVGVAKGMDEMADAVRIARHGARLDKVEACAFFPTLNPEQFAY